MNLAAEIATFQPGFGIKVCVFFRQTAGCGNDAASYRGTGAPSVASNSLRKARFGWLWMTIEPSEIGQQLLGRGHSSREVVQRQSVLLRFPHDLVHLIQPY